MDSPLTMMFGAFNGKVKVYPDGTKLAVYCNQQCFKIPDENFNSKNGIKRKGSDGLLDFVSMTESEFYSLLEQYYFYYSIYEHLFIFFPPDFIFFIDIETVYSAFLDDDPLDKYFPALEQSKKADMERKRRDDSVKRSRDTIYDIVSCNHWEYFFTGTLGNTSFDPTDAKSAVKPLQNWLRNSVNRYGLKYILIPEYQPKSGKIHFHGFINNALDMVDSGTKKYRGYKKPIRDSTALKLGLSPDNGKTVYNVPQWRFGFTTAIHTYNGTQSCARYIMKYVTKDCKEIFGRYYWSSRNLSRSPDLLMCNVDFDDLKLRSYRIPKTKRTLKYYTFFPGQEDFHYNSDNLSNDFFDFHKDCIGSFYLSDYSDYDDIHDYSLERASDNSAAILDALDGFEEITPDLDNGLLGFEEV